jgi:CO/xanthine dehydrogenase FAD-binding subunit
MRNVFLPRTLEELWQILEKESSPAIYAGGTDLLVRLRSGLLEPSALVCIERVEELREVREQDEAIFLGAATTHSRLLEHPLLQKHFPVLIKSVSVLGSPPVRHMGTIGGNIVTASPAGDTLPALHVLAAEVEVLSATGSRRLPIRDFIQGPGMVALAKGEVMRGVWLKKAPHWSVHHFEKVGKRKAQACAVASLAALLDVSADGTIEAIRLAWGSVGPSVVVAPEVEAALTGRRLCTDVLGTVRPLVEKAVSPVDDIRASAAYRRIVSGALLLRLLEYRCERA